MKHLTHVDCSMYHTLEGISLWNKKTPHLFKMRPSQKRKISKNKKRLQFLLMIKKRIKSHLRKNN